METKIIANYLPQYHRIPENDAWWGEGFTDWIGVKNAKPQFEGHNEPRVPENNYYYSLDRVEDIKHQVELANEYGIYGFGIYHYWFSDEQHFLEKPANIILEHKELDIKFMFLWDNTSWIRSWSAVKGNNWAPEVDANKEHKGPSILAELIYGDEKNWKVHFDWLLPFFKDDRYIKIDGKPVFGFMRMNADPDVICRMAEYWDKLAKEAGLPGVCAMSKSHFKIKDGLEYQFCYEPFQYNNNYEVIRHGLEEFISRKRKTPKLRTRTFESAWKDILVPARKCKNPKLFYSGIVGFDDTPRRGKKARIITGGTPEKFEKYLTELLSISKEQNKEYVFLTAWNEWGEGAYLEPDTQDGTKYLEAVRNSLKKVNG